MTSHMKTEMNNVVMSVPFRSGPFLVTFSITYRCFPLCRSACDDCGGIHGEWLLGLFSEGTKTLKMSYHISHSSFMSLALYRERFFVFWQQFDS